MTRLWEAGELLRVWADADGVPRQLIWREVVHPVKSITKLWRLHWGWWLPEEEQIWRDYFKVETTDGLLAEIYHNLLTGKWYFQRWYD